MSNSSVTEQIITKLHRLETSSEESLVTVLDFVSFLEARLDRQPTQTDSNSGNSITTADFLLGLSQSFAEGLTEKELANLPKNGAENHDKYVQVNSSCFELTSHLIGIGDDLPEDLSTNPDHMAGYGL
ncbi:hypothetical protein NIES208_17755 [[Limnothrix rosea] IAM M-220]|nr:hypothetical protein NIES208_17755 [[Limnothrix rosea] IAM M-220]